MASNEGSPLDGRDWPEDDEVVVEEEMLPRLASVDCKLEIEGKLLPGSDAPLVVTEEGEVTNDDDVDEPLARLVLLGPFALLFPLTMELVE